MSSSLFGLLVLCVVIGSVSGQTVTTINENLYVIGDGFYLSAFWVTPNGVLVIDAPPNIVANTQKTIPAIIAEHTEQPVRWFVYSHHHLDHVGAVGDFTGEIDYICHKKAKKWIKSGGLPPCTTVLTDKSTTMELAPDFVIQFDYQGFVHTLGNLWIYIQSHKFLMVVDVVFPKWGPYYFLGLAGTLVDFKEKHDQMLEYDFEHYVGGHWDSIGDRQDVRNAKEYIEDLEASITQALQTVDWNEVMEANGGWDPARRASLYRAYTSALDEICIDMMLNEYNWGERLQDVEGYLDTHCFIVAEHLMVNY